MGKYLLDTDICVHFFKGKFGLDKKIKEIGGFVNCFVSEITIAELTYGAYKSSNFEKHIKEVNQLNELVTIVPIRDVINLYGKEKVRLQKEGNLIPDFDLLIGTTAVKNKLILVSNNERHLGRVAGIQLENWTKKEFNRFAHQWT